MRTEIDTVNAFAISRQLSTLTRDYILNHNYPHVWQCLALAEKWLREGSQHQQMAIANDFMFSLSTLTDRLGQERRRILALLPPLLQHEYQCQINAPDI